ncbi:MAG: hypothetical protein N4A38_05625 [Candidatus Gracilibacteria bacterium]|nr:hypothetical protein [Candidatus Gracilibacteria bacterium]
MLFSGLFSLLIGIIIIINPDIIAYIIGGIFVFIGISSIIGHLVLSQNRKKYKDDGDYFTFGNYKIYKNKK